MNKFGRVVIGRKMKTHQNLLSGISNIFFQNETNMKRIFSHVITAYNGSVSEKKTVGTMQLNELRKSFE